MLSGGIDTVFLDRDGTINHKAPEGDYVKRPEEFSFLPGAKEALRILTDAGLRVIVVTNQRGIALGRMSEADLNQIHELMWAELSDAGAEIAAIYHCPHEQGQCDCRKPEIGMFLAAQRDFPGLEFERSVVIGDSQSDMQAAERLGAAQILIGSPQAPTILDAARSVTGQLTSDRSRS